MVTAIVKTARATAGVTEVSHDLDDGKRELHVEVDEKAAARFPFGHGEQGGRQEYNGGWGVIRRRDGTVIKQ